MNDTLAQAVAAIIQYLGPSPILLFLAVMGLVPSLVAIWLNQQQNNRIENLVTLFTKQMNESEQRYENNVVLVKDYETLVRNQQTSIDKLIDFISAVNGTQQTLVEYIKNNWWCPVLKDPTMLRERERMRNEPGRTD